MFNDVIVVQYQHYYHKIHHNKYFFAIYLSIMAACQELVELEQTVFKIMLTALGPLAVLKTHS